ncbi:MAG: type II toxin-antitoxin system HicA family toxin [Tissierellales bacterium]|nr:type II toxin-antitoxin system HicA family toxin [Tissierellales bacterium]
MSHKLPVISGEDLVKYLAKHGFEVKRQTSSHVVVQKEWRVFSVPLHRELKEEDVDRDPQTGRDRSRGFQTGIPVGRESSGSQSDFFKVIA